jgi:mannose-6-phosphate isomerase
MHLLEACLAWMKLGETDEFRRVSETVLDLLATRFFDAAHGVIHEVFDDDLAPLHPSECHFEPGHHFEWIWLLGAAERTGLAVPAIADTLYASALKGIAVETDLPFGEVAIDGTARVTTCRLWQLTEWLRAESMRQASGRQSRIERPLRSASRFLSAPVAGLWHEHCDAVTGNLIEGPVFASSLYHITSSFAELPPETAIAAPPPRSSVPSQTQGADVGPVPLS